METETLQRPTTLDYTKESVKLIRNSKGFTWEIKTVAEEGLLFSDKDLKRLKKLEEELFQEYGNKE